MDKKARYAGWKVLLKVDIQVLLAVLLLGFCWLSLHTMSVSLGPDNKPSLSFYELLKFINGDGGMRGFLKLERAKAGICGVVMWLTLLFPLLHCWYPHRYTFLACAAPLAYMGLCALGVYAGIMHRVSGFADFGSIVGGQPGRAISEQMLNDTLTKIWASISFESGFYIGLAAAGYLACVGVVKFFLYALRKRRAPALMD